MGVWYDFVHGRGAMMIEDRIIRIEITKRRLNEYGEGTENVGS